LRHIGKRRAFCFLRGIGQRNDEKNSLYSGIDRGHNHDWVFAGDGKRIRLPSEAVPRRKAPKMQVQLLNSGEATKQYAVILDQGDEAFSGLLDFAEKYQVTSAHFTAIGALNGATLGWFDPRRKMYKKIPIVGQHEVIGMSGDIALYQGKPVVHTHMVVGNPDGTTRASHVLDAYVSPTLEVMVTVDPITMRMRLDPATDLTLIDPALK
jgi:uncharacterized protein